MVVKTLRLDIIRNCKSLRVERFELIDLFLLGYYHLIRMEGTISFFHQRQRFNNN